MVRIDDSVRRCQVILSSLFLIACICFLIGVHITGVETEVMRDRFWKNAEPLFNGEVPVMEYPPFALVFFAIPRLFADTPWGYNVAYVAEVLVFMVIGLLLVSRLAERMGHDPKKAMLVYAILMLVMIQLVTDRYDIFPAILTLASFYMFVTRRYVWAGIILAVATMTKLYPAVLFPLYFIYLSYNRQWNDVPRNTMAFVGAGVAIVAVAWLINPELITNFLSYHTDRPLQIESLPASLVYPFSIFGLIDVWIQPATSPNSFGSDNLMGVVPDAVASVMMPLMILMILAVYAVYAFVRHRGITDESLRLVGLAVIAVLMIFMVVNKVFSSQYVVWIVAPVAFIVASERSKFGQRLFLSVLVMFLLTQLNFAYNMCYLGGGSGINDLGMMELLIRNLVAVYIIVIVLQEIVLSLGSKTGADGCTHPSAPLLRGIVLQRDEID